MKAWWCRRSVRVSLTLWYVGVMVVVLAIYAATVVTFVSRSASKALNDGLQSDFRWAAEMADQTPDGTLVWFEGDNGSADEDSPWVQVWSPAGQLLYRSAFAKRFPLPESLWLASRTALDRIQTVSIGTRTFRVLGGHSTISGKPIVIEVARSEASIRRELRELVLIFVFGLPLGVAAAGLGGYSLARRALAPVDRMAERARHITAERLSDRLPIDNPNDELGRLAAVFNETLGRLEPSFDQMRRFTADVSHELRTPLTALRSVGEVGLRGQRDGHAYRTIISSMLEEVDRLACLVDRLLALSRAESGPARLSLGAIDLRELADDVAAHLGVLAEEKQQSMRVEPLGAARCLGDRVLLRQALINLVDNAIKYTPVGGTIRIRVSESPTGATLDVTDTGPGIHAEPRTRIFDRFYRVGRSRSDEQSGVGLGLAIAKWAVEANGGQLSLEQPNGTGSTFRMTLPIAAAARVQDELRTATAWSPAPRTVANG